MAPYASSRHTGLVHHHETFPDLLIHDNTELAAALGAAVVSREAVHAWPLSATEELRLADGRRYAYKAQLKPSVEAAVYAAVEDPLLPAQIDLGRHGTTRHMVTQWVDAPSLHTMELDESEFVGHARAVVARISAMAPEAPVFLDLSTGSTIAHAADVTAGRLNALIHSGQFVRLDANVPDRLRSWSREPQLVRRATEHTAFIHGDLSTEEVFVAEDGYHVIDWQRPILGTSELDLVSLLRHRGIDPLRYVDPEVVQLSWFVLLHWAGLVQTEVLPGLDPVLPESWAVEAVARIFG
ncbi:MAG: phosphotransferase [Galactobacter sp.]